jgi:hypothetical protein
MTGYETPARPGTGEIFNLLWDLIWNTIHIFQNEKYGAGAPEEITAIIMAAFRENSQDSDQQHGLGPRTTGRKKIEVPTRLILNNDAKVFQISIPQLYPWFVSREVRVLRRLQGSEGAVFRTQSQNDWSAGISIIKDLCESHCKRPRYFGVLDPRYVGNLDPPLCWDFGPPLCWDFGHPTMLGFWTPLTPTNKWITTWEVARL